MFKFVPHLEEKPYALRKYLNIKLKIKFDKVKHPSKLLIIMFYT